MFICLFFYIYFNKHIKITFYFLVLRQTFQAIDTDKTGFISTDMIGSIVEMLGGKCTEDTIDEISIEVDPEGTKKYKNIVTIYNV
jgi:Ca2+-binding EF-hand superfamily protein